jgi:inorganic pyrophosphatase
MHLWHDLEPLLPNGLFRVVVEIAQGGATKYEVDKPTGLLRLDRILHGPEGYPCNYGIFPRTVEADGDPLDALVLCHEALQPGTLATVRLVGLMHMTDQGVNDHKVLCVVDADPHHRLLHDVPDIPAEQLQALARFFESYTKPEGKVVSVPGYGNRTEALAVVQAALARYQAQRVNVGGSVSAVQPKRLTQRPPARRYST